MNQRKTRTPVLTIRRDDFQVDWFSGSGAGGQHRNKHHNCCRITHPPSGVVGVGQDHSDRPSNQRDAFRRLAGNPKFVTWVRVASARAAGIPDPEETVDEMMNNDQVKIETKDDHGRWVETERDLI